MDQPHSSPTTPTPEILTYQEASAYLRIPVNTLYWMVHENRIPHIRIGARSVRFRRSELDAWLAKNARPVTA